MRRFYLTMPFKSLPYIFGSDLKSLMRDNILVLVLV